MEITASEVVINGETYIKKSDAPIMADKVDGLPYVLIRTYSAGVHVGYQKGRVKDEVTLIKTRRIYYWDGAASLSQIALEGVKKPQNCKFTVEIPQNTLLGVIEVIPCTAAAVKNITEVPVWKK